MKEGFGLTTTMCWDRGNTAREQCIMDFDQRSKREGAEWRAW